MRRDDRPRGQKEMMFARAVLDEETQELGREAGTTDAAAFLHYLAARACSHTGAETVSFRSLSLFWLVGSFGHSTIWLYT